MKNFKIETFGLIQGGMYHGCCILVTIHNKHKNQYWISVYENKNEQGQNQCKHCFYMAFDLSESSLLFEMMEIQSIAWEEEHYDFEIKVGREFLGKLRYADGSYDYFFVAEAQEDNMGNFMGYEDFISVLNNSGQVVYWADSKSITVNQIKSGLKSLGVLSIDWDIDENTLIYGEEDSSFSTEKKNSSLLEEETASIAILKNQQKSDLLFQQIENIAQGIKIKNS